MTGLSIPGTMTFHAMVFTKFNSGFCINKTRPLEISAKLYRFMIKVKSPRKDTSIQQQQQHHKLRPTKTKTPTPTTRPGVL